MTTSCFFIHSKLVEITWPQEISERILAEQLTCKNYLEAAFKEDIEEIRLGFHTLSISFYRPISIPNWEILYRNLMELNPTQLLKPLKCWRIPVCYDPELGYDLSFVAGSSQLSEKEVVRLHSSQTYRLHFYGFLPGFMYLGGLPPKLETGRKAIPDRIIKAGSVAIGGQQTGIYPSESPGGWQVIGRSPLRFFNIKEAIPVIPQIGEGIRFYPISLEEFDDIIKDNINYQWQHD